MNQLINNLLYPKEEFTPILFWFLNDMPEKGKIRAQIHNYVEKGVNGLVIHPRIGVTEEIPYLSDTYFDAVRFIVKTADEQGMKIVLYDEGMYPSGSAHGQVVAYNKEFASRGIRLMSQD